MIVAGRTLKRVRWGLVALGIVLGVDRTAVGQLGMFPTSTDSRYELSEKVRLDEADISVRSQLERVKEHLAEGQWDEAIDTLGRVMEGSGEKLLGVTERRFVSVRDYCHLQLATLPPEALARYRSRVDPAAEKLYAEGFARRDRRLLLDLVEQAFASSWGDNGLMALGEIALESGDHAAARAYWERIIPVRPPDDAPITWLSVPDTDLDLAAVRARLVLVSILEGAHDRAADELAQLARLHPEARGRLGGREVVLVEALTGLLRESADWPKQEASDGWSTFAGSPTRNTNLPEGVDPGEVAWRIPLRKAPPASPSLWGSAAPLRRVAEPAEAPLSYHPVLAGNLILVNNQVEILALDIRTGLPAWGRAGAEIFRDPFDDEIHALFNPPDNLGVPRFTMTQHAGKLYARMGSSVTSRPTNPSLTRGVGYLVCLDLAAQGRLMWRCEPDDRNWAFDGSPVTDGTNVYVTMRRSDIQPQVHVACFDGETGRRLWRRFVCAAETPARGMLHETTHNLLSLDRETLYLNTNLGAVAALSTSDGRMKWVSLYPRALQGDLLIPPPHTCRDLTPCLVDGGRLLVAPSDSRRIFALDSTTGQILWQTGPETEDVVHLLGVVGDTLIAGGNRLYWIGLDGDGAGRVKRVWPDGHEKLGHGRGVLAGNRVYWPTREKVYVFDQSTGRLENDISLAARGTSGGNLMIAADRLIIAGNDELIGVGQGRRRIKPNEEELTSSP